MPNEKYNLNYVPVCQACFKIAITTLLLKVFEFEISFIALIKRCPDLKYLCDLKF